MLLWGCSFDPGVMASDDTPGPMADADPAAPDADPAAPDADPTLPDSAPGPDATLSFQVVEAMTIDVTTDVAQLSTTVLEDGVTYRLRASGTMTALGPADADYYDFTNPVDVGSLSDMGLGVNDPVIDFSTTPDWGPYDSSHVYEVDWVGDGNAISVRYHDGIYTNNAGTLKLEILALQ